jgi:hypothetical protein
MTIAIALALLFLLVFVAWLFSTPRRGGHQPPKNTHPRPHSPPPPPPPFAGWTKPVAPPNPEDRPKGLPPLKKEEVWIALYFDFSGFALFTDELEARRYANEHDMNVRSVKLGKDVPQQL